MMKILHIHPSLSDGGIESMICHLSNEMVKTNDVTICTIFAPKAKDTLEQTLDSRIKRVSLGKVKPGFSLSEIFKIYSFIRKGGFDAVHIHGFFYYYALTVLLLSYKVKFFYTVHNDAYKENTSWDRLLLPLKRWCFRRKYLRPITISRVSQDSFTRMYNTESALVYNGIKRKDIRVSENLISEYRITPSTKVFIHAGRITLQKNQEVLCRAFHRLIEEGQDVVLLIAGANQDDEIFKVIESYFSQRIVFLGSRSDVVELMSQADAMCLSSIWEGLPVTLLEALSVGCIPICSPVGGIVDVVKDGYNGLLSEDSSESAYYDALCRYMSMTCADIDEMKRNCVDSFDPYDINNTAAMYVEQYSK